MRLSQIARDHTTPTWTWADRRDLRGNLFINSLFVLTKGQWVSWWASFGTVRDFTFSCCNVLILCTNWTTKLQITMTCYMVTPCCPHLYDDIHETLSCIDSMHKSNHKASNHHNKEYRTIIDHDMVTQCCPRFLQDTETRFTPLT